MTRSKSSDAQLIAAAMPGPWQSISLAGGFSAAAGTYAPAGRQWFSTVQLCGAISGAAGSVTNNTVIGTLPAGMRPASTVEMNISVAGIASLLQVGTGGNLIVLTTASGNAVFLDGLSFRFA